MRIGRKFKEKRFYLSEVAMPKTRRIRSWLLFFGVLGVIGAVLLFIFEGILEGTIALIDALFLLFAAAAFKEIADVIEERVLKTSNGSSQSKHEPSVTVPAAAPGRHLKPNQYDHKFSSNGVTLMFEGDNLVFEDDNGIRGLEIPISSITTVAAENTNDRLGRIVIISDMMSEPFTVEFENSEMQLAIATAFCDEVRSRSATR